MKYVITTEKFDENGMSMGAVTHTVSEDDKGEMVPEVGSTHTFEGDFFDFVDFLESCSSAMRAIKNAE